MKVTRIIRRMAALLMTVLLLFVVAGEPHTVKAATRNELESQLSDLKQKEKELKKELAEASSDLSASQQRKNLLDSQIANAEQQIGLLNSKISTLDKQMAEASANIDTAQKNIEEKETSIFDTKDKLNQRLRAIMKTGNQSSLQVLMNTENYQDYLIKSKAVKLIAAHDQAAIDDLEKALVELQGQKKVLEDERQKLQQQKADIESARAESTAKKYELNELCADAQREINNLKNTVSGYNDQLEETRKKIEKANAAIAALIQSSGSTGVYNQSMMYWPIPTVRAYSSVYGERWGRLHKGLDIANGPIPVYGENIVAAADGTVIAVNSTSWYGTGWSYGYGYCIIIDHGRDARGRTISTLYAHCSKVFVTKGQKVTGGKTVIAQAGKSGDVTGPHLHFEVRVNGTQVDPLGTYVSPKVN
ncbi:MAG: hypothetical protein E7541_02125 [Ruminococcaceae bacterium]|nr:hypothetical protein [Oscillospiraceae bacterium]